MNPVLPACRLGAILAASGLACTAEAPEPSDDRMASARMSSARVSSALLLPPDIDTRVTLASEADITKRREDMVRLIWGAPGLPKNLPAEVHKDVKTINQCSDENMRNNDCKDGTPKTAESITGPLRFGPLRNLKRVDDLIFSMDLGERSIAHHFIAKQSNNRLVIMHQGHCCTLDGKYLQNIPNDTGIIPAIDELLAKGYSVLGMYMPHIQPDLCGDIFHDDLFIQAKPQNGHVVKFYVEPIVVSLNYLRTKSASDDFPSYISYDMVGLSGGSWTTVFYSALDPTIERSVDVSGSLPFHMRKCESGRFGACLAEPGGNGYEGYVGDAEQAHQTIYSVTGGYLDLYTMGGQGRNRNHVQVTNRVDENPAGPGPFTVQQFERNMADYEKLVQAAIAGTKAGAFRAVIDTVAPRHMITAWTTTNVILPTLDRGGTPPDASVADSGSGAGDARGQENDAASPPGPAGTGGPDAAAEDESKHGNPSGSCSLAPAGPARRARVPALPLGLTVLALVLRSRRRQAPY